MRVNNALLEEKKNRLRLYRAQLVAKLSALPGKRLTPSANFRPQLLLFGLNGVPFFLPRFHRIQHGLITKRHTLLLDLIMRQMNNRIQATVYIRQKPCVSAAWDVSSSESLITTGLLRADDIFQQDPATLNPIRLIMPTPAQPQSFIYTSRSLRSIMKPTQWLRRS